mmetsp:Transcript_31959/g.47907  ORF Transcript_31959/g.47907 Transcript_31959/m.47907 type:complete len:607 (-) Transcript_31959:86-1906(-)
MDSPPLRRQQNLLVLSIVAIVFAAAAASNVSVSSNGNSNSNGHDDHQRDLSSITGTTACANCTPERCVSTTVSREHCGPCATGQPWWPCNLPGECYCSDDAPLEISNVNRQENLMGSDACSTAACTSLGGECVTSSPNVNDAQCADCEDGKQAWWPCNVLGACICKTRTEAPTLAPQPIAPTSTAGGTDDGANPIAPSPTTSNQSTTLAPSEAPNELTLSTRIREGMLVLDAHITANKIVLARELLLSPSMNGANANTFTYMGFKESLQRMIMTPIMVDGKDPKTNEDIEVPLVFYIGDMTTASDRSKPNNERVYGLVNVALFLATSYSDSLSNGSCDEINSDVVDGFLPVSNACGQQGMSYQGTSTNSDFREGSNFYRQSDSSPLVCAPGDEKYACDVDLNMRARARSPPVVSSRSGSGDAPGPFYCGPKTDYNGFTGHWSFEDNEEIFQSAKQNRLGRTDVQGCCFWGRGSVPIKGTCAYGKLNYYLGKRAADEGRQAMFPDIDFCQNPGAICHDKHPDLKWIVGFFRWITEIQEYDVGDFNYMKQLRKYVDDGFKDSDFIDSVSGIVSQGCHTPPCIEGAQFLREEKRANFVKVLKMLGFSVP